MLSLQHSERNRSEEQRLNMIEGQLRPNGIHDEAILTEMERLPREKFVPSPLAGIAYIDTELALTKDRYLLRPLTQARLLKAAALKPDERVLEIGSGTGYLTSVLATLAKSVVALEPDLALVEQTRSLTDQLNLVNIDRVSGPLELGWKAQGPYHAIIINGAVETIPDEIFSQLAEGGRLVTVFRKRGAFGAAYTSTLRIYTKLHGQVISRDLMDSYASVLSAFKVLPGFTF